jgi:hypothetical protein
MEKNGDWVRISDLHSQGGDRLEIRCLSPFFGPRSSFVTYSDSKERPWILMP